MSINPIDETKQPMCRGSFTLIDIVAKIDEIETEAKIVELTNTFNKPWAATPL